MEDFISLRFLLRTLEDFYNFERWQHFFTFLGEKNYKLTSTETASEDILPELQEFIAQQNEDEAFYIEAYGPLPFQIGVYPQEGALELLIAAEDQFPNDEDGVAAYLSWLELLKDAYIFWHPLLVYQTSDLTFRYNMTQEDALAGQYFNTLYDIAIYGPSLVEKIGHERLLSAPAWIIEELADGAIMLVPREHYYLPHNHTYRTVAQHLNFKVPPPSNE